MADSDRLSFEEFVASREPRLLRTAVFLTGNRHSGEDLLQDVLLRAYRHWRRVDDPDGYVRRALVNAANSRWRRRRRSHERPDDVADTAEESTAPHSDLLPVRDELMDGLRRLPERQRTVLVLRFFEDMSEAQVAEMLGCGRGTVKTHTARGLERMRHVLGADQSQNPVAKGAHP